VSGGFRVHVANRGVAFVAAPGRTFLEAAEDAGLRLPFGCRYGACLNCAARLLGGRVSMAPGTSLPADQLAERVFLPCVAEPRSACWIEVGDAMGVLDVAPWGGGG
jgi:ferredoxin